MCCKAMPHRNHLLRLLAAYQERYPEERPYCRQFAAFVEKYPDCFERTLSTGHVVGSVWLINAAGSKALLTHHKKLNKWLQLGGHADGNPDILETALREAREESGINEVAPVSPELFDIDIHPIPERDNEPAHLHYDARFLVQVKEELACTVSAESNELAWFTAQQLERLSKEESLRRMTRKWQAASQFRALRRAALF